MPKQAPYPVLSLPIEYPVGRVHQDSDGGWLEISNVPEFARGLHRLCSFRDNLSAASVFLDKSGFRSSRRPDRNIPIVPDTAQRLGQPAGIDILNAPWQCYCSLLFVLHPCV